MNPVGFHEIRDPVHGSIRLDEQEYSSMEKRLFTNFQCFFGATGNPIFSTCSKKQSKYGAK